MSWSPANINMEPAARRGKLPERSPGGNKTFPRNRLVAEQKEKFSFCRRIVTICVHCNTEFVPETTNQKYCSRLCYKRQKYRRHSKKVGHRKGGNLVCHRCGKDFIGFHNHQKFCSFECSSKARKKYLDIPDCLERADRKIDKNLGYVRVQAPMHPKANTWGYVYEHILIAERETGRPLERDEIVHYVNGIRWDNSPSNLQVMTKFEHSRLPKK